MRFITEMNSHNSNWLVRDTANDNAVVGEHHSATLAALDAFKREHEVVTDSIRTLHLKALGGPRR